MYLQSLTVENFRCFREIELSFQHPGREQEQPPRLPNINLLLGNNGMGKTTVLKAIALSILAPVIESAGYVPYSLVRRARTATAPKARFSARLELHEQDVSEDEQARSRRAVVSAEIRRIHDIERMESPQENASLWEPMYDDSSPAFLLVGYGAGRRVESSATVDTSVRTKTRLVRYQRVAGLFEDHYSLVPLTAWLPHLETGDPDRYRELYHLINRLLPPGTKFTGELENGEYLFSHRRLKVPFGALSDGYRAYLGWICDLLYHVCKGCPSGKKLTGNQGIVLIDEIDLHLHPEWQRTVLPLLSEKLPNLQFVCTTHSPIVAGTLEAANIFFLEEDGSEASKVASTAEEIHGLDAEQILLSPYFGLTSSRAPAFVAELDSVYGLAAEGDRDASLRFSRMVARGSAGISRPEAEAPDWVGQAKERAVERRGD